MLRASCPTVPPHGIYLDYQASTPVDPAVLEAMLPWWHLPGVGNAHSHEHAFGWRASHAIDNARRQLAKLIDADSEDIIFTSGATESNNLAIFGVVAANQLKRRTILVTAVEHASILGPAAEIANRAHRCEVLPVDKDGRLNRAALLQHLTEDVLIVSVGAVNNEIGTIQDISWIAEQCHKAGALLHTDAAQALTADIVSVQRWGVDFASFSSHKAYGPQGVGALYVAPGMSSRIRPLAFGGGQQLGMRPGTLPTALCVGFGAACDILRESGSAERVRIAGLRDQLVSLLTKKVSGAALNGSRTHRHPGNANIQFPGIEVTDLIQRVQPRIAVSSGSACHSGSDQPSHVLRAIGLDSDAARCSIRLGVGRFTTVNDVDEAVAALVPEILQSQNRFLPKAISSP